MLKTASSMLCAISVFISAFADDQGLMPIEITLTPSTVTETEKKGEQTEKKIPAKPPVIKAIFSPFTGKIKGEKVRMRLQPDLDGHIVLELHKHDLVSVIGDEGNFWIIEPPEGLKTYVFRSFVLDNVVEGNRVNIRLEPDLEAPIVGHLNAGDQVRGIICDSNKKWLEISPPPNTKFYIAKEYVEFAGGPELKAQVDKRKAAIQQLMESAALLSKTEMQKPYDEIDFKRIKRNYDVICQEYADFPEHIERAKKEFIEVQQTYLEKCFVFRENEKTPSPEATLEKVSEPISSQSLSDRMKMWEPIEEMLLAAWVRRNADKSVEEYDKEHRALSGILEAFMAPVKNKPGDYILKDKKNMPVAYLYSTKIDLYDYVGKHVTLKATERDNHRFAFPAYYVHSVE